MHLFVAVLAKILKLRLKKHQQFLSNNQFCPIECLTKTYETIVRLFLLNIPTPRALCPTVSLLIPTHNKLLYPCVISAQVEHRVRYRYEAFGQ